MISSAAAVNSSLGPMSSTSATTIATHDRDDGDRPGVETVFQAQSRTACSGCAKCGWFQLLKLGDTHNEEPRHAIAACRRAATGDRPIL
jgi:hypothetical protein